MSDVDATEMQAAAGTTAAEPSPIRRLPSPRSARHPMGLCQVITRFTMLEAMSRLRGSSGTSEPRPETARRVFRGSCRWKATTLPGRDQRRSTLSTSLRQDGKQCPSGALPLTRHTACPISTGWRTRRVRLVRRRGGREDGTDRAAGWSGPSSLTGRWWSCTKTRISLWKSTPRGVMTLSPSSTSSSAVSDTYERKTRSMITTRSHGRCSARTADLETDAL